MSSFDAEHVRGWVAGRELLQKSPAWLRKKRETALAQYCEQGLPQIKLEAYRKTSLRPLGSVSVALAAAKKEPALLRNDLGAHLALTFSAGICVEQQWVSAEGGIVNDALANVSLEALADVSDEMAVLLGTISANKSDSLTDLNTALFEDALFLNIAAGEKLRVVLTHLNNENVAIEDASVFSFSAARIFVRVQENANVEFIEVDKSEGGKFISSRVLEAKIEKGASLSHLVLSDLEKEQDVLREIHVDVDNNAAFYSFVLPCGGRIHRTALNVHLRGEEAKATSYGAILADDKSLVDVHSLIHHHVPRCISEQEIRGLLAEKGHGVFNGHVIFEKNAQQSETAQKNPNLLLSRDAIIDTQPVLEIYADDVKASHGSTVGQLDADAYFYLRSRGLNEDEAYHLLVQAFAQDVLHFVENDDVREMMKSALGNRLSEIIARVDAAEADAEEADAL